MSYGLYGRSGEPIRRGVTRIQGVKVAKTPPANGQALVFDEAVVAYVPGTVSAGGGAENFTELGDVPGSYLGQAGKFPAVKGDETGLEFVGAPGGGSITVAEEDGSPSVSSVNTIKFDGATVTDNEDGSVTVGVPSVSGGGEYSISTLPDAALNVGKTAWCTNGDAGNPVGVISNGTQWLKLMTSGVVSLLDIPDDGLLMYLRGDTPGSGVTVTDLSGGGHNGAMQNGASWASPGIALDGSNQYVSVADGWTDVLSGQGTWTVEVLVQRNDASDALLWSRAGDSNFYGSVTSAGAVRFRYGTPYFDSANGDVPTGSPQSIVFTYDNTAGQVFVNGTNVLANTFGSIVTATDNLNIGTYWDTDLSGFALDGTIFRFAIWNRVLTSDEISSLAP